ncbi:MAG: hypothetical protein ABSF69_09095 [Polyangiaceae bacterium]|jgi:hypothetical protein
MGMRCRLVAGGLVLAVVGSSRRLLADSPATAVRLEFVAPPGCPNAADFESRVRSRVGSIRTPPSGAPARLLRGEVQTSSKGAVGRILVIEPNGRTSERTIVAADCRQATEAIGLMAALAIVAGGPIEPAAAPAGTRPSAPANAAPAASVSPPAVSAPPPAVAASPPAVAATAPPPAPLASPPPMVPQASPPALPPLASASGAGSPHFTPARDATGLGATRFAGRPTWSVHGSAAAISTWGMAPGPTQGVAALVGVAVAQGESMWVPSLRVGLTYTVDREFSYSQGAASFGLGAGVIEACPLSAPFLSRWIFRPCAIAEYGVLRAAGSDTYLPHSTDRPWAAVGVEASAGIAALGPLSVEIALGALVALDRDQFVLGSASVFDVPKIVGQATLGLGLLIE